MIDTTRPSHELVQARLRVREAGKHIGVVAGRGVRYWDRNRMMREAEMYLLAVYQWAEQDDREGQA